MVLDTKMQRGVLDISNRFRTLNTNVSILHRVDTNRSIRAPIRPQSAVFVAN